MGIAQTLPELEFSLVPIQLRSSLFGTKSWIGTADPIHAGVRVGSVAHCIAMSGPLFVWAAVRKAPIRVSVAWTTSLTCTFGCSRSYFAIIAFAQSFAPGASLSAQYHQVRSPS